MPPNLLRGVRPRGACAPVFSGRNGEKGVAAALTSPLGRMLRGATGGRSAPSAKPAHRGEHAIGEVGFGQRSAAIPRPAAEEAASLWAAAAAQLPPAVPAATRAAEGEFPLAAVPPG